MPKKPPEFLIPFQQKLEMPSFSWKSHVFFEVEFVVWVPVVYERDCYERGTPIRGPQNQRAPKQRAPNHQSTTSWQELLLGLLEPLQGDQQKAHRGRFMHKIPVNFVGMVKALRRMRDICL